MDSAAPPSAFSVAPDAVVGAVTRGGSPADRQADTQARRNAVTSITGVIAVALVWAAAETARAAHFPERRTKAVIAAVVAVAACVQLVLGVMVVVFPGGRAAGTTVVLKRIHRTVGTVTLLGAGFVTYLCMTGPFPGGPTLHRIVGFGICAIVLVKIPVVVNVAHRRILVTVLGLLLAIGFITAFLTNGLDALSAAQ